MHYLFWSKKLNVHFGYWRWGDNPFNREAMLQRMNGFVASQMGISASQKAQVLDIGCGFGATIGQLQGLFPKARFTGIGKEAVQLEAAKMACPKADFMQSDFQAMPFAASRFDAAFAIESACFAEGESKEKLLAEAARVLRPGGVLVMVDGFRKHGRALPYPVAGLYRRSLRAWGMSALAPIGEMEAALLRNGFCEIERRDISWNLAPSLLHIPWVAARLFAHFLRSKDRESLRYLQALMLTLALSPFKRHFGYYVVTCRKTAVQSGN